MLHVDWLTARQDHPEAPEFGSVLRVDFDSDGAVQVERMLGEDVRLTLAASAPASRSSHLRVRSWRGTVEVSGNPSKWGRLEAVAAGVDLDGAFGVYNQVLDSLGLPRFSAERWVNPDDGTREVHRVGAQISRMDLATNLVTGSKGAREATLDWLACQRWGRRGHQWARAYPGYLRAGSIKRALLVCYDKGAEVAQAAAEWGRFGESVGTETAYLNRVATWADEVGLLRWELRLGSKWLSEHGKNRWADWRDWKEAETIMGEVARVDFGGSPGVAHDWQEFDRAFLALGLSERVARARRDLVLAWMAGVDVFAGVPRRSRYRMCAEVREALGMDLREKPDVRALGVRVRREVVLRPMASTDLPVWYRREAVPCVQGVPHRQALREAMARPGPDVLGLRRAA